MLQYITEIQRQLVENYGFKKSKDGIPWGVPDGAYPMIIDQKLDLVLIELGGIRCCNFIGEDGGLKVFQMKAKLRNKKKSKS